MSTHEERHLPVQSLRCACGSGAVVPCPRQASGWRPPDSQWRIRWVRRDTSSEGNHARGIV
eukprot:1527712-Prymnesium_polylepis.1